MAAEPVEIIIDTDAGIDDATAILGALRHPNARVKVRTHSTLPHKQTSLTKLLF